MTSAWEWTPERIAALIALWRDGLTTSEIGGRLGVTKNAVIGKAHRLGLPKRAAQPAPAKPDEPAALISMAELRPGMCLWPTGDPGDADFRFCGRPSMDGKPYCAGHCAKAYVRPSRDDRRDRRGDRRVYAG